MLPQNAIRSCLAKALTFEGRASRSEFWWFMALNVVAGIVAVTIDGPLPAPGQEPTTRWAHLAVTLAFLLPNVSVAARRLHDLAFTARWLLVVPIVIGVALSIGIASLFAPGMAPMAQNAIVAANAMISLSMIGMFVAFAFRGTSGPNRYGPDPLAAPDFGVPDGFRYKP